MNFWSDVGEFLVFRGKAFDLDIENYSAEPDSALEALSLKYLRYVFRDTVFAKDTSDMF